MSRSRMLSLGCAIAVLAACSDPIVGPQSGGQGLPGPQLVQLVGVVELIDAEQYGLRQSDRLVPLIYSVSALSEALGMEVRVTGNFTSTGAFSVSSIEMQPEPEDAFSRVPGTRKHSAGLRPRRSD